MVICYFENGNKKWKKILDFGPIDRPEFPVYVAKRDTIK